MVHSSRAKGHRKARIRHPADNRNKNMHEEPSFEAQKPRLPRMPDYWTVAPVPVSAEAKQFPQVYQLRVKNIRTSLLKSMTGFVFTDLPCLSHDEVAKIAYSFNLIGDNSEKSHDNLLRALLSLFNRMQMACHAYCSDPQSEMMFYAFIRFEYYNSLSIKPGSCQNIARALASIDVQLLVKFMKSIVGARRAYNEMKDQEALDTVTRCTKDSATGLGQRPSRRDLEKATRALLLQFGGKLTMEDKEHKLEERPGSEMKDTIPEDQDMQDDKSEEAVAVPKANNKLFPPHLLKALGTSVDSWIKTVDRHEGTVRDSDWAKAYGEVPADAAE